MDFDAAVRHVDEHIQLTLTAIKVGSWVLVDEDGLVKHLTKAVYSFPTKKEAIDEFGSRHLDARRSPKVLRLKEGHYCYIIKDCDTGHDGESVDVIKLTNENISQYREMLKDSLESYRDSFILKVYDNPLYKDDEERGESVKKSVRLDIYDPADH